MRPFLLIVSRRFGSPPLQDFLSTIFPIFLRKYLETTTHLPQDSSVLYLTAIPPSGRTVGVAKRNFFNSSAPQYPWPKAHPPGVNFELIKLFYGSLDEKRNEVMKGKKHVLMVILAGSSPRLSEAMNWRQVAGMGIEEV